MPSKNKIASCIRCNLVFNTRDALAPRGWRSPHILQCGHTICEGCLISALRTDVIVTCSICSKQSLQKEGSKNLQDFPINLYIAGQFVARHQNRFQDDVVKMITFAPPSSPNALSNSISNVSVKIKEAQLPPCEECSTESAQWYCENCPAYFCSTCFTNVHGNARALKNHVRAPILSQASPLCEIHQGRRKDFFCTQCNVIICPCCAIGSHNGHSVMTRAEMNEEQIDNVNAAVLVAAAVLEKITRSRQELEALSSAGGGSGGGAEGGDAERALLRHFAWAHGVLQRQEEAMLAQLEGARAATDGATRKMREELADAEERTRKLLAEAAAYAQGRGAAAAPAADLRDLTQRLLETRLLPCRLAHAGDATAAAAAPTPARCAFTVDPDFAERLRKHCSVDIKAAETTICLLPLGDSPLPPSAPEAADAAPVAAAAAEAAAAAPVASATAAVAAAATTAAAAATPAAAAAAPEVAPEVANAPPQLAVLPIAPAPAPAAPAPAAPAPAAPSPRRRPAALGSACAAALGPEAAALRVSEADALPMSSGAARARDRTLSTGSARASSDPLSSNGSQRSHSGRNKRSRRDVPKAKRNASSKSDNRRDKLLSALCPLSPSSIDMKCPSEPPFLNFPHLISEHPPEKPFVAVGKPEVINVVHVKSPSSFYVHRDQDKTVLEDLQKFLETCPERNSPPPDVVAIGQMFICKFLVDDKWYRVVVKDCTAMLNPPESCEAIVDIFYVDYGNSDRVPLSSLKPLPAELSEVPPFALHCSIFDLHPRGNVWSDEAYRTFCKMVNGVRVHMQVMSFKNDTYYIDLCAIPGIKNRNFPVSMRDAFVFMNFGCMEDENRINIRQCSPHFDSEYLEEEPLSKGEHFLVVLSHIESPSQFYAQRRGAHAESLLKVLDEMTHYYKDNNDMVYDPGMGMPCAAQFSVDKSWYRARVIGIPRVSCVEVFYVDYGNHEEVPYTSIRKLPEKFMRIPPKAIECALVDVMPLGGNKWPKTASEYFLATTKDKELRLFVEDVSKPCTKVILYEEKENVDVCLNALMVRDGHALSIGVGASLVEYFKVEAPLPDIAAAIPVPAETEIIPTRKCNRKRGKRDPSGVGLLDSNELFTVEASKSSTINDKTNGPPFGVPITVVSMKSPNCLYVSLCSREEEIANLVQEMQIHYSGLPCSETTWKEGDKCAVWSEKYSKWQRATITALREIDADVFYKDIALPDTVPIQNLQVLHEKFANIHDGAVKCHMVGIRAAGGEKWSSVACEMLSEFVHKTYSELFITKKGEIENRSLPVELWAKVTVTPGPLEPSKINWVSINQSLMDNGMAIPTKMPDNMEIMKSDCQSVEEISDSNSGVFTENEGTMITFRSNDDLSSSGDENEDSDGRTELILCPENPKRQWLPVVPLKKQCFSALITYIDGDGNLWLHDIEDDETLAIIKSANTEVFGQSKPKPQDMYWFEGQICLAQFFADKCWYRGKIMQVKENDTYEVLFVDYGNTEECAVDMLRKDVILTHIPIQCRGVMLDEIRPASLCGKWKTEHLDFLQLTLDGCICQVTVVSSLNDKIPKVSIKMPGNIDVAELLVNMHYAIYSSNVTGELDFEDIIIEEVQDITDQEVKENLREEKDKVQVDKTEASKKTECVVISSEVKCDKSIGFTSEKTETAKNANDKIMENVNKKGSMHIHEKSNDINTANSTYLPKDTNIVDITGELQTLGKDTCGVNSANNDIENQTSIDEKVTGMRDVTNKIDVTNVDDVTNKVPNSNNKVLTIVHHVQGIKGEMSTTSGESEMKIQSNSASPDVCSNVKECFNEAVEKEDATYKNETFDKNLSFKKINLDNWDTLPVQVSILLDNLTEIVMVPEKNGNEEILFRDGFDVMTLEMQQEAASHPIIDFPYIGLPCCAQYSEDEKYYRAIILEIDECNNKALIEYVDYGNEEWLELKSIHHIKSTWLDIPVQGIKSHLWKIKIAEEFDKAIVLKNMTDVLFDRSLTAKIKERNPLAVELYVKDTENLVYKPLIDAGFIKNIQEI